MSDRKLILKLEMKTNLKLSKLFKTEPTHLFSLHQLTLMFVIENRNMGVRRICRNLHKNCMRFLNGNSKIQFWNKFIMQLFKIKILTEKKLCKIDD